MEGKIAKLTLTDVTAGGISATAINNNSDAIETALENTLSRDGTGPNQMEANLDMNSNRILNLPTPTNPTDVVRLQDIPDTTDIEAALEDALTELSETADSEIADAVEEIQVQAGLITQSGIDELNAETDDLLLEIATAGLPGTYYASTAAGISGTSSGDYFIVTGTGDVFISVYKNNGGVAEFIQDAPSLTAVRGIEGTLLKRRSDREGVPAWVEDEDAYEIDFTIGEAWDPILGSLVPLTSWINPVTEAGYTEQEDGQFIPTAANTLRLSNLGLRVDGASENLLANPLTPATQVISSLPGNTARFYALTVIGTGSATVTVSTGTMTALRPSGSSFTAATIGKARQGLPLIFAPSTTADLTVTVSGDLTAFCLTDVTDPFGGVAMPSTGTRAGDAYTFTGDLGTALTGTTGTALIETYGVWGSTTSKIILGGTTTDDIAIRTEGNFDRVYTDNGSGAEFASLISGISASNTWTQFVRAGITWDGSGWSVAGEGGSATAVSGARPAITQIGGALTGYTGLYGFVRRFSFKPVKLSDSELTQATTPNVVIEDLSYASSVDQTSYPYLKARVAYVPTKRNLPVLVVMHGFGQSSTDFDTAAYNRLARRGYFVVAPDLRSSLSTSGRDIQDIIDVIPAVRDLYSFYVDDSPKNYIVGYSAGGGNVLGCAMKTPDLFNAYIDHFGMSDYGYDSTYGWYYTNVAYQGLIAAIVGGTPGSVPNNYRSRYAIAGVPTNLQSGKLVIFHDTSDTLVDVSHSQRLQAAMVAAGNTNSDYYESTTSEVFYWSHGLPITGGGGPDPVVFSEVIWFRELAKRDVQIPSKVSNSGVLDVYGFLNTKRFKIEQGNYENSVSTATYNTVTGSYSINPATTPNTVTVTQGPLTKTQTISSTTVITPA